MSKSVPNFTIHKPEQKGGWTMIWNDYVIRNKALDANEKEMLSVFLSFEDGSENICKKTVYYYCSARNEKTNDRIFNALKQKGHFKLIKNIDALNHKIWWDYEVYQIPLEVPVPQYEIRYTTAPDKMLRKASPDVVAQLATKYGLDPSVVESLHADLVATTPQSHQSAPPVSTTSAVMVPNDFYNDLIKDSSELARIAQKYEVHQEELSKHLENFKKNKKSNAHTEYSNYVSHFDHYVGVCFKTVKSVVKARTVKPKTDTPRSVKTSVKTEYKPKTNEELLRHARRLYADIKEVREDIPFSEYREQVDLFIQYAKQCEDKGISNEVLTEIKDFYAQLRGEAGGLRKYFDSQLQLENPAISALIKTVVSDAQGNAQGNNTEGVKDTS